jgi:hypothetical protein
MADEAKISILTPNFRMSFPNLEKPRQFERNGKPQGEPKYSVEMIFAAEDMGKFKTLNASDELVDVDIVKVCKELAAKKWPGRELTELFPKKSNGTTNWPVRKGDTLIALREAQGKGRNLDHYAGMFVINATGSAKYPPQLRCRRDGQVITLDRDNPEDVKTIKKLFGNGGNYASAEVSLVAQEVDDKYYVSFYLNKLMFKKEGKRLGGESLMDRFGGLDGGESDFDPTSGDSDFGDL